ncbi:MAG TPA: replication protein RepA [Mycobacterium sp.]|jgi:hypothetical protein|nr:replication protein RepA [Mycobacterium sp.]
MSADSTNLPRDLVRALDHLGSLERGELEERYGVAPSLFAQFGLFPLTAPDEDKPLWTRRNPFGAVSITRGVALDDDGNPALTRYPSGGLPRLFLVDLASEVLAAHRRGDEHPEVIDLGRTLTRYTTERLGLRKGSRNRAVLDQVTATARATITLTSTGTDERTGRRKAIAWDAPKVADRYELWLPEQDALSGFEPSITLSPAFVSLVLEGQRVPVRRDLLAQLAGKPMAFDVLLWLGGITYWLHRSGKPEAFFDWPYLFATFTHDYARVDHFTTKWKAALTDVMRYYPEGQVEIVRGARGRPGGVRVQRSPLLIEPRRGD